MPTRPRVTSGALCVSDADGCAFISVARVGDRGRTRQASEVFPLSAPARVPDGTGGAASSERIPTIHDDGAARSADPGSRGASGQLGTAQPSAPIEGIASARSVGVVAAASPFSAGCIHRAQRRGRARRRGQPAAVLASRHPSSVHARRGANAPCIRLVLARVGSGARASRCRHGGGTRRHATAVPGAHPRRVGRKTVAEGRIDQRVGRRVLRPGVRGGVGRPSAAETDERQQECNGASLHR